MWCRVFELIVTQVAMSLFHLNITNCPDCCIIIHVPIPLPELASELLSPQYHTTDKWFAVRFTQQELAQLVVSHTGLCVVVLNPHLVTSATSSQLLSVVYVGATQVPDRLLITERSHWLPLLSVRFQSNLYQATNGVPTYSPI